MDGAFHLQGIIMAKYLDLTGLQTFWNKIKARLTTIENAINGKAPNAPSEVTIANGDKIVITDASNSNKIARASVAFDGSTTGTLLSRKGTWENPKEAYLAWGGRNLTGSFGPLDGALVSELGANRFACGKAAGITIEYTRDGGTTWVDYGASDLAKRSIFTNRSSSITVGKADSTNKATTAENYANYKVRVIINCGTFGIYNAFNKFVFYVSTNGSASCYMKMSGVKQAETSDVWTAIGEMQVSGWSGFNVYNQSVSMGAQSYATYKKICFLFECRAAGDTNYNGLAITSIWGYGGVGWVTPSTLASTGHLYTVNGNQEATFPSTVTATGFSGPLTGNATSATKLATARKLAVSLSNTSTDSTFDGSADQTSIKVSGTLPIANGGTGQTSLANVSVGSATKASKINTSAKIGDTNKPVYVAADGTVTPISYTISKSVPSDAVFTDTDTKVTSSANHYTPATASGSDVTASATGATAAWSIDVVKGVTLNTDGKGHVTGISVTSGKIPGNPNTDTKVKATAKTDNVNYKILATASASPTSGSATEAVYDTDITLNPSTNTIAANVSGTATTAAGYTSNGAIATALGNKVDKVSGKGLSTNDFTNAYKSNVDSNTSARHTHSNKSVLDSISANNLVYDCGTGSTSTTDFDNALAAFNAGKWVIIHNSGNLPYYCVGSYSGPGLRFKAFADETKLLKVYTLVWTRGSAPSDGTQFEAALVGHTHSNYVPLTRTINGKTLDADINLSASDVGAVTASKTASQGSRETSLVTRGEKYIWNNKQDTLPGTWDRVTGQTYGIALDEGGIDQSLKNISKSNNPMTTDTFILVHDAVGETSYWKERHIDKLWDWTKNNIGSVLRLYTRENDTPYFNGLAANAVQAINTTNANITCTADVANGDKLQIGTGTAVNITNAVRANYADNAGNATSAGSATYATTAGKAYEDGNGTTLAPLVVQYQSGTFPDVFDQLTTAYSSKRRIFCLYGLFVADSTDTVEMKIPLSSIRVNSSGSIKSFEFATSLISRGSSSADIAGQIMVISANRLDNGSYNWGIEYQWPYASTLANYANTAGSAGKLTTARKTYVTLGTASTSTTRDWSGDTTIPVSGTLNISNGGTGATSAHAAFKNLTNESFDSSTGQIKHFIVIDDNWNRVGHATVDTVATKLFWSSPFMVDNNYYNGKNYKILQLGVSRPSSSSNNCFAHLAVTVCQAGAAHDALDIMIGSRGNTLIWSGKKGAGSGGSSYKLHAVRISSVSTEYGYRFFLEYVTSSDCWPSFSMHVLNKGGIMDTFNRATADPSDIMFTSMSGFSVSSTLTIS